MRTDNSRRVWAGIALAVTLAMTWACGDDGDDDDDDVIQPDAAPAFDGGSTPDASPAPDADLPDGATANGAPIAHAGDDLDAFPQATVVLDGSASSDPDDDELSFSWVQTSGPAVTLVDDDTIAPRFATPADAGTIVLELTVSDGTDTATDAVQVTVHDFGGDILVSDLNPFVRGATLTGGYDAVAVGKHLYVADGSAGLRIFDLGDPASPVQVGVRNTPGAAMSVAIAGNYAIVADNSAGLQIIDVTDYIAETPSPTPPVIVATFDTARNAFGVAMAGGYAVVAEGTFGGLEVVDVRDFANGVDTPAAPALAGALATNNFAFKVRVVGDRAYLAERGDGTSNGGLRIVDVADYVADAATPAAPALVGEWTVGGIYDVAVVGDYAFVAFNDTNTLDARGTLRVLDISTETSPVEIADTALDTAGSPYALTVAGDYLYLAEAMSLEVVDIADYVADAATPAPPSSAKVYPLGLPRGVAVRGDHAYVVQYTGTPGLAAVDVSDLSNPARLGSLRLGDPTSGAAALVGDYFFVAQGNAGLVTADVGEPLAPTLAPNGAYNGAAVSYLAARGDYLYISGGQSLRALDIADWVAGVPSPAAPTVVGTLDAWTMGPTVLALNGPLAFVAISITGIQVVDLSDPTTPLQPSGGELGLYTGFTSASALAAKDDVLYVARGNSGLSLLDVSDPATPTELTTLTTGTLGGSASELTVSGDRLYVSAGASGLIALDVSTATDPVVLGRMNPTATVGRAVVDGTTAYFTSGALQSVMVADLANPEAGVVIGGYGSPSAAVGLAVRDGRIYISDQNAGVDIAVLDRPWLTGNHFSVSPGAEVSYTFHWTTSSNDQEVSCEASDGSCVVTDHDRDANTATVTWTAPSVTGDYALRAIVGDWVAFTNAHAYLRVE